MSTITREQLRERAREKVKGLEFSVTQTAFADSRAELEEELELARIVLASLEAETDDFDAARLAFENWVNDNYDSRLMRSGTGYAGQVLNQMWQCWLACRAAMLQSFGNSEQLEPVTTAYKLPEETGSSLQLRNLIRQRHAEWSQATFGDVGPVGPLKHLSKEALEAAAEPEDLSEWADLQFLLWDAQRRAGISDGEITAAMEEKLKVNMARQWPEPKDGEPRLHIKADGNSPVIPDGSDDTKRLDWLDAQNKRLNEYYGTSYGWKFDANFQRNAMMLNDSNYPVMTVRQAIDEAMAAAPQQEVK